jgi:endonuclease/exonuclease/phosphatase family metal-dependent hydrolase
MHRLLTLALGAALLANAQDSAALRVMTFNVRLPSASDGPNVWENRRELLIETVRRSRPDVMGTQELFHMQGEYIVEQLPEYAWFGLSRRGNQEDEHMGVFYRKDRLKPLKTGDFWLSETPDEPGSMSWNVTLPRMVTWAVFEDLRNGRRFHYFNTHFPHRREDAEARVECARVLAERVRSLPPKETIIVTGDFNADAGREPHRILTELLTDAWTAAGKTKGPSGTFHGFGGKPRPGRIDWILYRGCVTPVHAETITRRRDGRYPSDHFPVLVEFRWRR